MKNKKCKFCGENIEGLSMEMWLVSRNGRNGNMMKVDLHPECFDKVWSRVESEEEDED